MLVKNWMGTDIRSIRADDTIEHAVKLHKDNNTGVLLVFDNSKLVGVVADRDIDRASVSEFLTLDKAEVQNLLSGIKVRQIMSPHPLTVTREHTMDETAEILLKHKISAAPVVDDDGKVVGIINRNDIMQFLMSVTGGDQIGYQLNCSVPDKAEYINDIINIIKDYDGRIWNIASSYHGVSYGFRKVSMRVYNVQPADMPKLLKRVKENTPELYVIDYIQNNRGIFED